MIPDEAVNQALHLQQQGKLEDAKALYHQILAQDPKNPSALHFLGMLAWNAGDHETAFGMLSEAVNFGAPQDYIYLNFAQILRSMNRPQDAIQVIGILLAQAPDNEVACVRQAALQLQIGDANGAQINLNRVIRNNAQNPEALGLMGQALTAQNRLDEALPYMERAAALEPENINILSQLGTLLKEVDRLEDAEKIYRKALALAPNTGSILYNLASLYLHQNRLDEAIETARQALGIDPEVVEARGHVEAAALLHQGNLPDGFAAYEDRLKASTFPQDILARNPFPRWKGQDIQRQSIIVTAEQGYGDTIQFVRYIPLLVERLDPSNKILLEAPTALQPLLEELVHTMPDHVHLVPESAPRPAIDCWTPLMSLPHLLGTTLDTIPANIPYLSAPAEKVAHWRKKLADTSDTKVGLVWMGNPNQLRNKHRSCPIKTLAPLTGMPGVQFFSLQKDISGAPIDLPSGIIDIGSDFQDFSDTAAAIANMDLVISVCTSVAHLTGALGKPLWVMLAYAPDWRWMLDRDDSPWYPTARLFRQEAPGDWAGVVDRVTQALKGFDPA